jgi:hypothetical protein
MKTGAELVNKKCSASPQNPECNHNAGATGGIVLFIDFIG